MICIFKCVSCGDKMVFSPEKQAMVCPTCGSVCEMESYNMSDVTYEGAKAMDGDITLLHCPGCGAKVSIKEGNAKMHCAYCDAELATFAEGKDIISPEKIIPMMLTKEDAIGKLVGWWDKHTTMPELDMKKLKMSFQDMYVPVWLIDMDSYTDIEAKVNCYIGNMYNHMDFVRNMRKVIRNKYTRVPFDASCHIQDEQFYNIEPFNYGDMKDFNAGYLSGHMAECYHVAPEDTLPRAIGRIKELAIDFCKGDMESDPDGGSIIDLHHLESDVTPSHIVYALVPVWVCMYTYGGKIRNVYINGQTGKVDGEVLFTGRVYERNVLMYALSNIWMIGSVLLLCCSTFFKGISIFFGIMTVTVGGLLYLYYSLSSEAGIEKDVKVKVNEELQLRHGMKVNAAAYSLANIVIALIFSVLNYTMTVPRLLYFGKIFECSLVTAVITLPVSFFMIRSFASKLTRHEKYIKKTRFLDYINVSETYELVKRVWKGE